MNAFRNDTYRPNINVNPMEVWVVAEAYRPLHLPKQFMVDPCRAEGYFFLRKYQGTDFLWFFHSCLWKQRIFLVFLVKVTFAAQDNGEFTSNGLGFYFAFSSVGAYAKGKTAEGAIPETASGLNVWRAQWKNYDSSESRYGYITVSLNNLVIANSTITSDISIDYLVSSNLALVFRRLHSKGWRH